MGLRVRPFRSTWPKAAHLGVFIEWMEIDEVWVGVDLGPVILGLAFRCYLMPPDPYAVDKKLHWELGTRFQNNLGTWRYARAGEDLKKDTLVMSDIAGRLVSPEGLPDSALINELVWGNVKAARLLDPLEPRVLGWPEVDVKKGRLFWLREPPPGAKFKKEEG